LRETGKRSVGEKKEKWSARKRESMKEKEEKECVTRERDREKKRARERSKEREKTERAIAEIRNVRNAGAQLDS